MDRTYSLRLKTFGKNPLLPGLVEREYQCETENIMYEWYLAFSESKKNIWQNYFEEEDTVQSYGKCQGLNIKLESTTAGRIRRGSSTFGNLFSSSKKKNSKKKIEDTVDEEEEEEEKKEKETSETKDDKNDGRRPVLPNNEMYQQHYYLVKKNR